MNLLRKNLLWYLLVFLALATGLIFYTLFFEDDGGKLKVIALNIGQGDSIFIETPNGNQIIVDGGPDKSLLSELGKVMPFYDHSIDMIVVTNPDKDHYAGFIDLLDSYSVGKVLEPGTFSPTPTYEVLEKAIAEKNIPKLIAQRGMKIELGGGAVLDILFPDRDVSKVSSNTGSLVAKLTYGATSFMLTGDSVDEIEHFLVAINKGSLKSDVLKVGHHGSRTSSSPEFVAEVAPSTAVMACGKDNTYGHPHKETLETLSNFGAKIFRTDQDGRVTFISDGVKVVSKN